MRIGKAISEREGAGKDVGLGTRMETCEEKRAGACRPAYRHVRLQVQSTTRSIDGNQSIDPAATKMIGTNMDHRTTTRSRHWGQGRASATFSRTKPPLGTAEPTLLFHTKLPLSPVWVAKHSFDVRASAM